MADGDKVPQGDQGGKPDDAGAKPVIELDGEKYDAGKLKELLGQVGAATQSNQIAARLKEVSGKYGVDPTNYLAQAEGALGVISDLIEKGVIDERGEIVQHSNSSRKGGEGTGKAPDLDDLFGSTGDDKGKGASDVNEIVTKALGPIAQKLDQLSEIQAGMIRENYGKRIKESFSNLDDEDVSRVFASYQRNRSVPLMEHAKKMSEKKAGFLENYEKQLAEKWGVDLDKVKGAKDENDVKDAQKGGPGVLFQGKKFSMRQKGDDFVNPREAARAYLDKVMG